MSDEIPDWERLLAAERHLRLGAAQPVDAAKIELAGYRGLGPPWNDWKYLAERGRAWARILSAMILRGEEASG